MRPPFNWTEEIENDVLTGLMAGKPLTEVCGQDRDDWMPSESTVYKRLASDEEFAEKYARARQVQAHREFEEIREIADAADPENVAVARLRIDARKWRASKMAPKVYGERLDLNHSGGLNVTLESDAEDL